MKSNFISSNPKRIENFAEFLNHADFSFVNSLHADPLARKDGNDHIAREVHSGHYVPVKPKAIKSPQYVSHSNELFSELGLSNKLIEDKKFKKLFTGDFNYKDQTKLHLGWSTGYALSIYGREYIQQCPFGTGNGYGDGRAISVFEGIFNGNRWEMQLKGSGPTPYCRGGDGRAVLRSSVREFLAQEFMNALGIPTSRSLVLYVSLTETVSRPWYSKDSNFYEPDILEDNPVAISTRVAPSFLRVGQLELFSRRVRNNSKKDSYKELEMIVKHIIHRNYMDDIDMEFSFKEQIITLARIYRERLTSLVANWIRVGYCQGNFNSDNCALGGFTLDYGPFGFLELFDPSFQPWTGGGKHFSFFNQTAAAAANYKMFCESLKPLLENDHMNLEIIDHLINDFTKVIENKINLMWNDKLGLKYYDDKLVKDLLNLLTISRLDYTSFFRKLSNIDFSSSFLKNISYGSVSDPLIEKWNYWLNEWNKSTKIHNDFNENSKRMNTFNPKYTWREWLIVPAYEKAKNGDFSLIRELQNVLNNP